MYRNNPNRNAILPCRNGDGCYFFRNGHCNFYHGPALEQDAASSSQGPSERFHNDGNMNNPSNPRGYICNRNPLNLMNDRTQRRDSYLLATNQSPAGGSNQYDGPVYNNTMHSPARSSHTMPPLINVMSTPPQQQFGPYNNVFEHGQPNLRPDMSPQQGNSRRSNNRRRPSRFGPRNQTGSGSNSSFGPNNQSANLKRKGSPLTKNSKVQKVSFQEEKEQIEIEAFQCPISMEMMDDPVVAADGHSYERTCIEQWLRKQDRSPLNNTRLASKRLIPNHTLRKSIQEWNAIKLLLSPREPEEKELKL